ncbi:MAG: snoRNA-binding rRNA-processing protein imp4 [Chaenotheca gracillima]|nr:MAG: snoRNA-binding rRNA-processing protein imp4 [Chaenotheca gracillima]
MARRSSKKRAPIEPVYPKLVALGKSTELLSEQLQTACTILGLTEEQLQWIAAFDESQIQDHASLRASSFYGQEEYVLRWLLGKLQAGGDGGLQARSSSKAWTLLQYLIQVLPPVNAARLMKGIKFLQVVEQALRELASSSPALSTTKPQNGPGGSNSDSTVRGDSMELGSPASSRKRKRNGSPSSRPEASKHQSVSDETSHRIIYVLNYICDLSNSANIGFGSNHEPYALEHMKSLLRTDLETAAKVFGYSMRLLLSELPIVRGPADVSKQSQRKSLLRGGFAVWRQRSKESDDAQDDRSNVGYPYAGFIYIIRRERR